MLDSAVAAVTEAVWSLSVRADIVFEVPAHLPGGSGLPPPSCVAAGRTRREPEGRKEGSDRLPCLGRLSLACLACQVT